MTMDTYYLLQTMEKSPFTVEEKKKLPKITISEKCKKKAPAIVSGDEGGEVVKEGGEEVKEEVKEVKEEVKEEIKEEGDEGGDEEEKKKEKGKEINTGTIDKFIADSRNDIFIAIKKIEEHELFPEHALYPGHENEDLDQFIKDNKNQIYYCYDPGYYSSKNIKNYFSRNKELETKEEKSADYKEKCIINFKKKLKE